MTTFFCCNFNIEIIDAKQFTMVQFQKLYVNRLCNNKYIMTVTFMQTFQKFLAQE